jgi:NADH-quinone oxidoreductase subunit E
MKKTLEQFLAQERMSEVNEWIEKYPEEERQSAVMRTLMLVQEEQGYLAPEAITAVADYLHMPEISVYEVATFYSMYHLEPVGKHTIGVCRSFGCQLRGSDEIVKCISKKLNVEVGGTTDDKRFTLREVECLGACVGGPVVQIDKDYHEHLTEDTLQEVLDRYK